MAATNAASEADRAAEVVLARERWLAQALHEVDIADEADAALDAAEKLLRPRARVIIHGLAKRSDLNDLEATLLTMHEDRWAVRVTVSGEGVRVKAANLRPVTLSLRDRLGGEADDLLSVVLSKLCVSDLLALMATETRNRVPCRAAIDARSIREKYEFDRLRPGVDAEALMRRAYHADGFGDESAWMCKSMEPRTERLPGQKFRVGDMYYHATSGAFGFVVGWDARRNAPLEWGNPRPERLYAVHYSVVEFKSLGILTAAPEDEIMTVGGAVFDIDERYIVQDNMRTVEEYYFDDLVENQWDIGGRCWRKVRELWDWFNDAYIHPPIEPDPPDSDGLGILRARLKRACKVGGFYSIHGVEAEEGGGFMPDKVLGALYPADALLLWGRDDGSFGWA